MDWIEISVQADGEAAEAVSALFNKLNPRPDGQGGAVTEVAGFDPIGEAHRPQVTVRTYLPASSDDTAERQRRIEEGLWFLGRIWPAGEPQVRRLAEDDWANAWKAHYRPLRVGRRFVVVPAWLWSAEGGIDPGLQDEGVRLGQDDLPLILDPGMAFGTGLHPSTQLCLAAMETVVRPGQRILDAGCGSGILSIAAARLGVAAVQGFDIDPIAARATQENAALNDLPIAIDTFVSTGPDGSVSWPAAGGEQPLFDVILVNILLPVIVDLLKRGLARSLAPAGRMLLAGVIADQETQLRAALAEQQLAVEARYQQGDWVAFVVTSAAPTG